MKRVIFSLILLTLLVAISFGSFAVTSKSGHKTKHATHHVIHPVDHFTI